MANVSIDSGVSPSSVSPEVVQQPAAQSPESDASQPNAHIRTVVAGLALLALGLIVVSIVESVRLAGVLGAAAALAASAVAVRLYGWAWVGIGQYRYPKGEDEEVRPPKTLWDILQLLIISGVLALGAIWYSDRQTAADREQARAVAKQTLILQREQVRAQSSQAEDSVLNSYLAAMTDLLLREGLRSEYPPSTIRTVARARTVAALATLDAARNAVVTKFLADAGLYDRVRLEGADLSGTDLTSADLGGAYLAGASLSHARLARANLIAADLAHSELSGANFTRAFLSDSNLQAALLIRANLSFAFLIAAQLQYADLEAANLRGAQLVGANLDGAQLKAANLEGVVWGGTICPDGTSSATNHTFPQSCRGHLRTKRS
jgi:uncharacterized protein YjbI with pentapeptide repeats